MDLNERIAARCIGADALGRVGAAFGVGTRRGALAFGSEMERDAVVDTAMCDLRGEDGRTPAQAYMEDVGPASDLERAMLEARINSTTSLFTVTGCDAAGGTVGLSDRLRGEGDVVIHDIGMSMSAIAGYAIFTRLLRFPELASTSGVVFAFHGGRVPSLVRRYGRMRERPGRRGPISRCALFFRQGRRYGVPRAFTDEVL